MEINNMITSKFIQNYGKYMAIIGPIGNLLFFFQAYKIISDQSAANISLIGFSISSIALTSWFLYGIFLKNIPMIIANAVGSIGSILVLICIIIYS